MRHSLTVLRSAIGHARASRISCSRCVFDGLRVSQLRHDSYGQRLRGFSKSAVRRRDADSSEFVSPDARLLREAFDNPAFFKQHASRSSSTGRFAYPALHHPSDFPALVLKTRNRAQAIVNRLLSYSSSPSSVHNNATLAHADPPVVRALLHQVKQIDRLSDLLCGVIDVAEVIRNCDPSPEWKAAADTAYSELCYFMNELNTHVQLYNTLKQVHDPAAKALQSASLSSHVRTRLYPALVVSSQFLADFEKSGIHMSSDKRRHFVELSDRIISLEGQYMRSAHDAEPSLVDVDEEAVIEASPFLANHFRQTSGSRKSKSIRIDALSQEATALRSKASSGKLRKQLYMAAYGETISDIANRVQVLDSLLATRYQLATLVGKSSYAEVALSDKMAASPDGVKAFLATLASHGQAAVSAELELLKATASPVQNRSQRVETWDRDFLMPRALKRNFPTSPPQSALAPYFSIGTCVAGLSALFSRLYGVTFQLEELQRGEIWQPLDIRKIAIIDEVEGRVGVMYLDLFAREGKPNGAAHFTVRCARRVDDDVPEEDRAHAVESIDDSPFFPLLKEASDVHIRPLDSFKISQTPVVYLTCEFDRPEDSLTPCQLTWHEVETLFHEMGHAMHSMLGRTDYHNVAGTRCPTDLVELPSILMEHFVTSPDVLTIFARHHRTGASLPIEQWRSMYAAYKGFKALETNYQLVLATFDQLCHSDLSNCSGGISTSLWHQANRSIAAVPAAPGTAWQAHFMHLVGYGSTYYSYLFDRALASRTWKTLFQQDPTSRLAGEALKSKLLRHGGGIEPWSAISDLLDEQLTGDIRSMESIGRLNID